jgi:hypothetical protein
MGRGGIYKETVAFIGFDEADPRLGLVELGLWDMIANRVAW